MELLTTLTFQEIVVFLLFLGAVFLLLKNSIRPFQRQKKECHEKNCRCEE